MKYVKKPIEIEAVKWDGQNYKEIQSFAGKSVNITGFADDLKCVIKTLEGDMTANKGDYIIKGVKGEFYPCKPGIFKKTYSIVKEETNIDRTYKNLNIFGKILYKLKVIRLVDGKSDNESVFFVAYNPISLVVMTVLLLISVLLGTFKSIKENGLYYYKHLYF